MTPSFPYPERVPLPAVERLLGNFAAFLSAVHAALQTAAPGDQLQQWKRAASLLGEEQAQLEAEAEAHRRGTSEALLSHASQLCLLALRMDSYPLLFAGPESAEMLAQQRQLVVLTAWQIAAAASGSEAAGL